MKKDKNEKFTIIKTKKQFFKKINIYEIISIILLIIDLLAYKTLLKYFNMLLIFALIMSICFIIINIFEKNKNKKIDNILGTIEIIHILIIGICSGQICYCGYHYIRIIPLLIYSILELVAYHKFIVLKENKTSKEVAGYIALSNIIYLIVFLFSVINMNTLHATLYK